MLDDLKEAFFAYILRKKVVGQSSPIPSPNRLQGLMLRWMRRIHLVLHFNFLPAKVDATHPALSSISQLACDGGRDASSLLFYFPVSHAMADAMAQLHC